jgi:hypothetical protein
MSDRVGDPPGEPINPFWGVGGTFQFRSVAEDGDSFDLTVMSAELPGVVIQPGWGGRVIHPLLICVITKDCDNARPSDPGVQGFRSARIPTDPKVRRPCGINHFGSAVTDRFAVTRSRAGADGVASDVETGAT